MTTASSRITRKILKIFFFPRVLANVNAVLSNEFLARLEVADAAKLYGPLAELRDTCAEMLDGAANRSLPTRILFYFWVKKISKETERLSDVVEALAWSSDEGLRNFASEALRDIRSRAS